MVFIKWPSAILGIIFSSVGIAKARRGAGGKGLAMAGLILGILAFISVILATTVFAVAFAESMEGMLGL